MRSPRKKPADVIAAFEKGTKSVHLQWESTGKYLKYLNHVIAERNTATGGITKFPITLSNYSSTAAIKRALDSIPLFNLLDKDNEVFGLNLTQFDARRFKRHHSNNGTLVLRIEPVGESS
jgi:hypothetical protein